MFDKATFDRLVIGRVLFFAPAFEIYGGVLGLYDYGPPGAALQENILKLWRQHFVIEDEMLELDTAILAPEAVLQTSGHVEKLTDWLCEDMEPHEAYRADHVVENTLLARLDAHEAAIGNTAMRSEKPMATADILEDAVVQEHKTILIQIHNFSGAQLGGLIRAHNIMVPETGYDLTEPVQFNLLVCSSIGPTGNHKAYLRPENAQGHFVNFMLLFEYNNRRLPFASAQIGKSFRNEISPCHGMLRTRDSLVAEIEHLLDPAKKLHKWFGEVIELEKKKLEPILKKAFVTTQQALAEYDKVEVERSKTKLEASGFLCIIVDGQEYRLPGDAVAITTRVVKTSTRGFVPHVIGASFGIDCILYSVLEHTFWTREADPLRTILSQNVTVAPFKCLNLSLNVDESVRTTLQLISHALRDAGTSCRVDWSTASIAEGYAKSDELGFPFSITIDPASVNNSAVTLRERDSREERIGKTEKFLEVVKRLCRGDLI